MRDMAACTGRGVESVAQLAALESQAMLRRTPGDEATGIVQWMLNNAWSSNTCTCTHTPVGGWRRVSRVATACAPPLAVQRHGEGAILVVNLYVLFTRVRVSAEAFTLDATRTCGTQRCRTAADSASTASPPCH